MSNWLQRIDALDLSLFNRIESQTSPADRISLLAAQRATARCHPQYTYLEIGSHLGGSIQPHLVDQRCKKIYSIDARPRQQPDDRSPGYVAYYENNSSERMLALLGTIGAGEVNKIECFDLDASQIETASISDAPDLIFIDGEHTNRAVLSDFEFCNKVVGKGGTILFHDFFMVYPAILEICRTLDRQRRTYLPLKFESCVFGIFFSPQMVYADSFLAEQYRRNKHFVPIFRLKVLLKKFLPGAVLSAVRAMRKLPGAPAEHPQAAR